MKLIFFENSQELEQFYDEYFLPLCIKNKEKKHDDGDIHELECLILNEELTVNEKERVNKDACRLNTITLCTRVFYCS